MNPTTKPIRLWWDDCELGNDALSFRVEEENTRAKVMSKGPFRANDFADKLPPIFSIPPGTQFVWKVMPSIFRWSDSGWRNVPEPNTGKSITLTAFFEIKPTESANKMGVWTGRIASKPISAKMIDPTLQTPHQYLWNLFPKQALKMLEADPKWVNKRDQDRQTPLHIAARFGPIEVVKWLLNNGADVNATAYNSFTALHMAEDPEIVKLLLQHKADLTADSASETALKSNAKKFADWAAFPELQGERAKWRTIVKLLLDAGAYYDIESACYLGDVERVRALATDKKQVLNSEVMRIAAQYGHAAVVKVLLEHGAKPEREPNEDRFGDLPIACFAVEHPDVLKLLLDAGANPKVRADHQQFGPMESTLLHEAAACDCVESAKLLLPKGLDIEATDSLGQTPLHVACSRGNVAMVEYLVQKKANPTARRIDGLTPMALAVANLRPDADKANARYQDAIRALARAGIDVNIFAAIAISDAKRVTEIVRTAPHCGEAKDHAGKPALHLAIELDSREIVKILLDGGCIPDVRSDDENGFKDGTALLLAVIYGRLEMAELLIQHGANVNGSTEGYGTPLHAATGWHKLDLAELLLKHGADVNANNGKGETPLDLAKHYNQPNMVELLRRHGAKD
jgi:ankyrin repeat protein